MYKLKRGYASGVLNTKTKANIPEDSKNADWKKYQKWLAEGNIPEPADPEPVAAKPPADITARQLFDMLIAAGYLTPEGDRLN